MLDEAEKAHQDIFNLMLQVFDDGYLTDSKGRKVDFRNTIIIMTSNLGATRLRDEKSVGFGAVDLKNDHEAVAAKIRETLKETFRPEFINRLDEAIVFESLTKQELHEIVKLMSRSVLQRVAEQGITIKMTPAAIDVVASAGFDPEYGARPIRRSLQTSVEDALSEELLRGNITTEDACSTERLINFTISCNSCLVKLSNTIASSKRLMNSGLKVSFSVSLIPLESVR
ncbi:hypothetical protein BMS81_00615 [Leuconostoc pseudomesenteroides]|nr:hypothetical protein BMS81_00615 [Leuconostoc pseudomesenteroides]